jgi:23S rRNA (pseudouridine1915-N3)-methyltransferase
MSSKLRIICIGKIKERYISEGINEYLKRLTSFAKVEIIEIKDEGINKESEKLLGYLGDNTFVLDDMGKELSSPEFAQLIKKHEGTITFIIGGHDGIDELVKLKSNKISLSRMTYTHEMARLFLIEQIYRAYMINTNRKYHR